MKRTILLIASLALSCMSLPADINPNAGEYGYQFLDISTNPVSLALAGRGINSGYNLASFVRQPASSILESHRTLGISHTMWLADTFFNNLYYSYSTRKSHFGVTLRNLDYGELEIRDDNGYLIGTYHPLNMDLMANYALRITPTIYAGMNAGIAYEKLDTDSSYGVHTDLGVTLLPPVKNTKLSIAVRNLGISSAMNEERTMFAPSLEIDLSKQIETEVADIIIELSGIKAIDENWKGALSTELTLYDIVKLRLGYKANYDAESLTAGLGIQWQRISLDYGWAAFSSRLTDVHSLGLSYAF